METRTAMGTSGAAGGMAERNVAQLFRNRAATYGDRVRWRQMRDGTEQRMTWRENQAYVNRLIAGLDALGVRPGDVVGILSESRWEWMAADWAIIGLGAVGVTVYPSNVPPTVAYILNDSGASYVFAENAAQYEKLRSIRDEIPNVRRVILFDPAGAPMDDPWALSLEALAALGPRTPEEADAFAAERAATIAPDDRFTLVYTSGTTGMPKGVVHTHATVMAEMASLRAVLVALHPGMVNLLFLPLAHILGRVEHLGTYDQGLETVVAESLDRLADEMRRVRPHLIVSVPRIYEKAYATIHARVAHGSATQRRIFGWATSVGLEVVHRRQAGKPVPPTLAAQYRLADRLVFHKVREALGGNLILAITAAAPLDLSILEFFHAAGAMVLEGWGMTETCAGFTTNTVDAYRLGSVGHVFPGMELRVAADGEIQVRGGCMFTGYHNRPEANAESFVEDGWFCTGDIGEVDADGYVRIVDRKKDLLITAGGKNIAPQQIENVLKSIPLVSQAAVYGDRKPYIVALLTLDPVATAAWAHEAGLTFAAVEEVYGSPQVRAHLDQHVARVNQQLARYEQVKQYDILPEDFTVANDLLTPTLKIRRRAIHARYRDRYEALYQRPHADAAEATATAKPATATSAE